MQTNLRKYLSYRKILKFGPFASQSVAALALFVLRAAAMLRNLRRLVLLLNFLKTFRLYRHLNDWQRAKQRCCCLLHRQASVGCEKNPRKFLMREKNLVLSRKKAKQSSSGSDHFEAALKSQVLGPTRPSISGQDFYTFWCVRGLAATPIDARRSPCWLPCCVKWRFKSVRTQSLSLSSRTAGQRKVA